MGDFMATISLCMIVKNEEDVLERCLKSVRDIADEIIIVDTGSSDKSKDIAKKFTELVFDFDWCDNFSLARNFAFSKATKEYCLWLDADDVIMPTDREAFLSLKKTLDPNTDIVMMKYNTAFDEHENPVFSYYRERLVRNDERYRWSGAVHEAITPSGNIEYKEIAITHKKMHVSDSDRNLRILKKQKVSVGLEPREQYYYARELYYHQMYVEAIEEFTCFLRDGKGWIENNIDACRIRGHCYYHLGKEKEALLSYYESFYFVKPRGELCCDIAAIFFARNELDKAIYWYEAAASCKPDETSGAFVEKDCYDFIPYLQLCVCYYRSDNITRAIYYNELAGSLKPKDKRYLYNLDFFRKKDRA